MPVLLWSLTLYPYDGPYLLFSTTTSHMTLRTPDYNTWSRFYPHLYITVWYTVKQLNIHNALSRALTRHFNSDNELPCIDLAVYIQTVVIANVNDHEERSSSQKVYSISIAPKSSLMLSLTLKGLAMKYVLVPMVLVPEWQQLFPSEFCKIQKAENCGFLVSETNAAPLDLV